eukprot:1142464-Pelagomonas_calceolata.AAC.2
MWPPNAALGKQSETLRHHVLLIILLVPATPPLWKQRSHPPHPGVGASHSHKGYKGYKGKRPQSRRLTASLFINLVETVGGSHSHSACF